MLKYSLGFFLVLDLGRDYFIFQYVVVLCFFLRESKENFFIKIGIVLEILIFVQKKVLKFFVEVFE